MDGELGRVRASGSIRLLALALALLPLGFLALRFQFLCDDAFISFRYARNLTEGLGLAFNPGVQPPVEGYTELGWVLSMALGLLAGVRPELLSLILSALAGLALVALSLRLIERASQGAPLPFLSGALFLGCLPPLAVWCSGGLATIPFTLALLLVFAGLHLEPRRPRALVASVGAIALVLLRADGAFWVACSTGPAILAALWRARPSAPRAQSSALRAALTAALSGAVVFALHVGWRLWYYGDWMPNTARVKLGLSARAFDRGWDYVAHFALTFPGVLLALGLALWPLCRRRRPPTGAALAIVLATAGYAVLVGGDFMAFGRFLVPALPFVAIAWAGGVAELVPRSRARFWLVPALSVLAAAANLLPAFDRHLLPQAWREAFEFRHNKQPFLVEPPEFRSEYQQWRRMDLQAREWADLGRALSLYVRPDDTLVFGAVGAIGYYSRLFIFDLNGLVTREVALREPLGVERSPGHDKTVQPAYFLKDSPTWLYAFFLPRGRALPAAYQSEKYLRIPLREDYDRVKRGDLLILQPGPGFEPR